jgi:hypothetical protein
MLLNVVYIGNLYETYYIGEGGVLAVHNRYVSHYFASNITSLLLFNIFQENFVYSISIIIRWFE